MTHTIEIFKAFPKQEKKPARLFVLVGYAIAFTLYYVDEGNYNFTNLMEQPAEWIFLSIYALLIAGSCGLVFSVLSRAKMTYRSRVSLALVFGILAIPVIVILIGILASLLTS